MKETARIDPFGFREYDARWLHPKNINQEGIKLVGKGFGTQVIKKHKNPSKNLRDYFYVPESKDPDFIIRTGGEIRLSNFMLWQSAYAELYFTKVLWPDFKINNLKRALDQLMKRKRNYGQ